MGLLLDLTPGGGMDDEGNDEELEAELLNLVGGGGGGGGGRTQGTKGEGRAPVHMAEIERMAALCMKDLDVEEMGDDDLDDEDLLAELNEVLEDDEVQAPAPIPPTVSPAAPKASVTSHSAAPGGATGPESCLLERIEMYKTAIANAKAAGETSKVRRYDRGLKTLQSMLTSFKKGKPVNEEEMPPPVALGGNPNVTAGSESVKERELPEPVLVPPPPTNQKPLREAPPTAPNTKPVFLTPPQKPAHSGKHTDMYVCSLSCKDLPAPSSLAEALQQRLDIYKSAAEGAKSKGDDRKARMHQRIVKQYQDAIRAHKAGRPVNLSDLPVPPGCPPLQGSEGGQQNFLGVLETAMKIANQDADADDDEEDGPMEAAKVKINIGPTKLSNCLLFISLPSLLNITVAQQQVDFLLLRRQMFLRAALRSKQMKDMAGATQHLRHAKGLDPMITAAKSGLPVDITKIPNPPEEDYSLSRSRTSPLSPRSSEQYHGLMDLLRKQHEKLNHQYVFMFERLVEECVKYIEILKNAHAKGHPVPKCRTEERTLNSVKINSTLTLNDLILYVNKGINLPAPSGVSANDLDASVKFEFPFPSAEEAQRDKTSTVRSTNSPEFKEQFKLNINRAHRGFKRVVQSKGIKFEIVHKGGLFKTDKVVGTAQLKLEALENHCDIREIIEVMDGRKATGGKLEVRVKIREPLSGVDLQPVTEKWLVLEPVSSLSTPEKQKERVSRYKLHSFSLLNYDRERLERKIAEYRKNRRDPPSDLVHQLKEVTHRLQWQKAQLERASPALLTGNTHTHAHTNRIYTSMYFTNTCTDAAKDALGRLKMVESEVRTAPYCQHKE
uniref:Coiled-coil and C2 domain-containing protein 1B n=1 Tax=Scophthalmus maximus TaxID=52904 RepID=A0A8D3DUZ1_SCOMX